MEAQFSVPPIFSKENILREVLQYSPFGFALINAAYIFEFANEAFLEIAQRAPEEVLGNKLFDIFPETEEQLSFVLENVRLSKKAFKVPEYRLDLLREGVMEEMFFNFIYHPIFDEGGAFQYFAVVILDTTEFVIKKNKLRDDEERLRLATESSQTATWDLDLNTSEIIHSPALSQILGYDEGETISYSQLRSHIHRYDLENTVREAFEIALETGVYKYEARVFDKNGVEKWVATHGKIFYNAEGIPTRMVGVLQDISKRKNDELLLNQRHHQLNTALDATRLGRFDMDAETQQKYNFSARFLEIFGYDSEKDTISSAILEKHIDKRFIDVRREALKKTKETGDLYYQAKINLRDGTSKWVEFYGRLLDNHQGSRPYIAGTVRDITEHKNYQRKISDSEKKYRFLADSMPQIVWIGESDGRLTYFNQATIDYSGLDYNEFIESNGWINIVHPDERVANERLWMKSVKTKRPFTFEHRFRNKDNEYRWFLSRADAQLDEFGNVKKWVGTSTDIHDMKMQDQHKNDFIKIANHELKTPVTTIKGYVQLLQKMRGNSEDKFLVNSLNTIENQVNKLTMLIGDLLDISRIESGSLPLNKDHFSIVKLVTETIEDIKASDQSHRINFELKHDADIEVFADKDRITQVLNNLLTNANKYSPQAGDVNVELFVQDDNVVVSVEDFGIGMDQNELEKIFERFYRVSGKDEMTFPGFGIGLFIVKDILERHQGKIWVESVRNEGSKFYFSLPL